MTATDLCRQIIIQMQLTKDEIKELIDDLNEMINGEKTDEKDNPQDGP